MTRSISTKEVAKLVRAELKKHFPKVKFSVRSDLYAGGSSVLVRYNDENLARRTVEEKVRHFTGSSFDAMTDMRSYHNSTLNGEAVHYSCDYVSVNNDAR